MTKNAQPQPDLEIDSVFAAMLATFHDIDDMLFESYHAFRDAHSVTERKAHYAAFSQGVYELSEVLTYLQGCQKRMREGVNTLTPGKIIPLRRRQPRDARGRFAKLTT